MFFSVLVRAPVEAHVLVGPGAGGPGAGGPNLAILAVGAFHVTSRDVGKPPKTETRTGTGYARRRVFRVAPVRVFHSRLPVRRVGDKVVPWRRRVIGSTVHAETSASAAVAVQKFGAVDFQLCHRPGLRG